MKLRENINSEENLLAELEKNYQRIKEYSKKIVMLTNDEAKGIQRYRNPNLYIMKLERWSILEAYFFIIKAKYTLGYPVSELLDDYEKGLQVFSDYWASLTDEDFTYGTKFQPFYSALRYEKLIGYIALSFLLNVSEESFKTIIKIRDRIPTPDILLDFLLSHKDGRTVCQERIRGNLYKGLASILQKGKDNIAVADIKKYLMKQWHKDYIRTGNMYTHTEYFHVGYWSFETGAVVKLLNLDDSSLKGVPYYPYDLVHYQ